jgi:hypothetical protein
MELKNIFKMEMFKNRNDKPYLLIIAILTVMAAVASIVGVSMIEASAEISTSVVLGIVLAVFTVLGLGVFSLLYPFHLLNTDYKNKVISLIFASGVSREKYYFVKISATILTCLIATLVILFVPIVTFLLVYQEVFVHVMQQFFKEFTISDILPFVLMTLFSWLAYYVMLTTSVIITKGKVAGIFLFFGFLFGVSIIQSIFNFPLLASEVNLYFNLDIIFSIVKIVAFVLIGLVVLKKQNL